jgi:hypothetical protein
LAHSRSVLRRPGPASCHYHHTYGSGWRCCQTVCLFMLFYWGAVARHSAAPAGGLAPTAPQSHTPLILPLPSHLRDRLAMMGLPNSRIVGKSQPAMITILLITSHLCMCWHLTQVQREREEVRFDMRGKKPRYNEWGRREISVSCDHGFINRRRHPHSVSVIVMP